MRRAGILLHPTSLPGPGPCGDLGAGARAFLDWLQEAGCGIWQILPLCPPSGDLSPYDSPGAFALGTHLLSIEDLAAEGYLDRSDLEPRPTWAAERVDNTALVAWHAPLVERAARRLAQDDPAALQAFRDTNDWVEDWALYRAVVAAHGCQRGWWDLPVPLRDRDPDALAAERQRLSAAVDREVAAQLLVHRQWAALRQRATARDIKLVGDIPIFVAGGGADTWAWPRLFRWGQAPDGSPQPDPVAGVPPDYFSPLGQRWGNPLYAWDVHRATGFSWWRARIRAALELYDFVRIDHFRGFCAAWAVPARAPDARTGDWVAGPGRALFDAVAADLRNDPPPGLEPGAHLPIIAEDLGVITPDVETLRDGLRLHGMKILQFAFGGDDNHTFLPHTWSHGRWVAYTGTHDNDTIRGWYDSASDSVRDHVRRYLGRDGSEPHWQLIRLLLSSTASWAVVPLQDVLGLDGHARMNVPGETNGNWLWRATELPIAMAERLGGLIQVYGRRPGGPPAL